MDGFGTLEGRRDVCKSSVVRADDTTPVSGWGFMLRGEELDALAALLGSGSHPTVLLADLPRQQRLSMALFYVDNLSIAEVAATLGLSDGAVKFHLHQGRDRLRGLFAVQQDAQP